MGIIGRRTGSKLDYPRSNLPTFPSDRIGDTPPKCPLEPTAYRTRGTVPRKITGGCRGAVISTFRPKSCCASSLLLVTFQGSVPCQCRIQLYAWVRISIPVTKQGFCKILYALRLPSAADFRNSCICAWIHFSLQAHVEPCDDGDSDHSDGHEGNA